MRGIGLKMSQLHCWSKWAPILIITVMLLGSACTLFSPPPPPPPPPEPENQPPVIHYMTAEKQVLPSTECQILCQATDVDGNVLNYIWSADDGVIKGVGDSITWIAPEIGGNYTVKVKVLDGEGGEAVDFVIISVTPKPNQPPVIVSLTREGSPIEEVEKLRIWRTTTIECLAEDPDGDELSFIWSATGGKVQGEGAKVRWTAPGATGDYTVTARVTDGRGGEAEASVDFTVVCCGH